MKIKLCWSPIQVLRHIDRLPASAALAMALFGFAASNSFAQPVGAVKWSFPVPPRDGTFFDSTPAIGPDGSVIVASAARIFSLDRGTGSRNWGGGQPYVDKTDALTFLSHGSLSSPALGHNGVIYIGTVDGNVIAINTADGSLPWGLSPSGQAVIGLIYSTPAIAANGNIYVATDDAGDPGLESRQNGYDGISPVDGTCLSGWAPAAPGLPGFGFLDLDTSFVISTDGHVIGLTEHDSGFLSLGTGDVISGETPGTLVNSIDPFSFPDVGSDLTSFGFPALLNVPVGNNPHFNSCPAIDADGTIYVGTRSGLAAVDPSFNFKWVFNPPGSSTFTVGQCVQSSPAIGSDGTIYFGAGDGNLYALPGGQATAPSSPTWTFTPPWGGVLSPVVSSPAVAQDGTVYITMRNINDPLNPGQALADPTTAPCVLFAVKSGSAVWSLTLDGPYTSGSPTIGPDGTVYLVDNTNAYAINSANSTPLPLPAISPWPMYHHDWRHTGRAPTCVIPPSGLISTWRADGNALDSIRGNNGTLEGSAGYDTGVVGSAFSLNQATGDHVRVPDSLSLHFSRAMSYEAWVYPTSDNDSLDHPIVSKWNAVGGINQASFSSSITASGVPSFTVSSDGYDGTGVFATSVIPVGQWSHIAATYDGSNLRIYVNGVLEGTQPYTDTLFNGTNDLGIGAVVGGDPPGAAIALFDGKIDELSLYDVALSGDQIWEIYNAGSAGKCNSSPACVAPVSGLVSCWKAELNAEDAVGGNNGTTENGADYSVGFVGNAFHFRDASVDHVRVPDSPSLRFSTAMSYEAWIYPTSDNDGNDHPIVSKWNAVPGVYQASFSSSITYDGHLAFDISLDGEHDGYYLVGAANIPANQWTHVAATYDGSNIKVYVNGNLDNSAPLTGTIFDGNNDMGIGAVVGGGSPGYAIASFAGDIDELSLYNVALTEDQIQAIYNAGSAGKCITPPAPPSLCVPPPSGLVSWWHADGDAVDSVSGNNGTLENSAGFDTGRAGQAFSLTYVSRDHVRVPDSASLRFSTAMSYEAWIYPTSTDDGYDHPIVSKWNAVPGVYQASFSSSVTYDGHLAFDVSFDGEHDGTYLVGSANIPANQWTHVAATFDGSNIKVYVNGAVDNTAACVGTMFNGDNDLGIGAVVGGGSPGYTIASFAGKIDEMSLYNVALSDDQIQAIYNAGAYEKCGASPPACATTPSGLVSLWHGELNALDSVGGNNGTLENSAAFATGEIGNAFSFDDATVDHVRVPDAANLHFSTAMSYEAWIYPTSVADGDDHPIVSKWNAVYGISQASFSSSVTYDGHLSFDISSDGYDGTYLVGAANIPANQWTHVAATYDGSNINIYVNGNLDNTTACTGTIFDGNNDLGIGAVVGGGSPGYAIASFAGRIDEVGLYNRALTASEIQAIYVAGYTGKCPP